MQCHCPPALLFCSLPPPAFLQLLHILSFFLHLSCFQVCPSLALLFCVFSSPISISPPPSLFLALPLFLSLSLRPWWGLIRVDERFLSIALVLFLVPSARGQCPCSLQETSSRRLNAHIYILASWRLSILEAMDCFAVAHR